jgi:predicted O-methyltransferase YrrM
VSSETTPLSAALCDYLAAHAPPEDPFLAELKCAAQEAGLPRICISPEQAAFFGIVLRACRVREVVEVGTLGGYSAIVIARAIVPGGRVRTIEVDPGYAAFAREWVSRSDVAARINVLEGVAADHLAAMPDASIDAMFIDADKESYPHYADEASRLVVSGGVVLVDNAFAFGRILESNPDDPDVPAIQAFNETFRRRTDFTSIIVPFGDGCWMGVKR